MSVLDAFRPKRQPMRAISKIISNLVGPITFVNVVVGIVSSVWLIRLGIWKPVGVSIGVLFFGHVVLGILMIPGMIFALPSKRAAEQGRIGVAVFLGGLALAFTNLIIVLWVFGFLKAYLEMGPDSATCPLLLISFSAAVGPWAYLAIKSEHEGSTNPHLAMHLFFLCVAYLAAGGAILSGASSYKMRFLILGIAMTIGTLIQVMVSVFENLGDSQGVRRWHRFSEASHTSRQRHRLWDMRHTAIWLFGGIPASLGLFWILRSSTDPGLSMDIEFRVHCGQAALCFGVYVFGCSVTRWIDTIHFLGGWPDRSLYIASIVHSVIKMGALFKVGLLIGCGIFAYFAAGDPKMLILRPFIPLLAFLTAFGYLLTFFCPPVVLFLGASGSEETEELLRAFRLRLIPFKVSHLLFPDREHKLDDIDDEGNERTMTKRDRKSVSSEDGRECYADENEPLREWEEQVMRMNHLTLLTLIDVRTVTEHVIAEIKRHSTEPFISKTFFVLHDDDQANTQAVRLLAENQVPNKRLLCASSVPDFIMNWRMQRSMRPGLS